MPGRARLTWSAAGGGAARAASAWQPARLCARRGFEPAHGPAGAALPMDAALLLLLLAPAPTGASERGPFPATPPLLQVARTPVQFQACSGERMLDREVAGNP